jgi:hypothetical protein
MAVLTYYLTNTVTDFWQTLNTTSPGADAYASPALGWIVGNTVPVAASNDYCIFAAGFEQLELSFDSSTGQPNGTPTVISSRGNCWRTTTTLSGDFASGNWTINGVVRAQTNGGAQDGRLRYRLITANADGTGATIVSTAQNGATVSNVSTAADFNSSITFNPGAFTISGQYLFIQVGWERTGAGGMSSADINFRIGTNSTRVITADFTVPAVTESGPAYINGGYYG